MVPLPAAVAETPSISLPLQSKHLVWQCERKGAVQLHKAGEVQEDQWFLKEDFQMTLLVVSSLLPTTLPEIPGPLHLGSLGDSVAYVRLLLSLCYCWLRTQLSQICQVIYTHPAAS